MKYFRVVVICCFAASTDCCSSHVFFFLISYAVDSVCGSVGHDSRSVPAAHSGLCRCHSVNSDRLGPGILSGTTMLTVCCEWFNVPKNEICCYLHDSIFVFLVWRLTAASSVCIWLLLVHRVDLTFFSLSRFMALVSRITSGCFTDGLEGWFSLFCCAVFVFCLFFFVCMCHLSCLLKHYLGCRCL